MEKQNAVRLCLLAKWKENCGFVPTTQKMFIKICWQIRKLKFPLPAHPMHGIRLNGKAVFENNMAAKEMCMGNPIVKGQYQTADNPIFEVFYLNNAHGVNRRLFPGNPPYEFLICRYEFEVKRERICRYGEK